MFLLTVDTIIPLFYVNNLKILILVYFQQCDSGRGCNKAKEYKIIKKHPKKKKKTILSAPSI